MSSTEMQVGSLCRSGKEVEAGRSDSEAAGLGPNLRSRGAPRQRSPMRSVPLFVPRPPFRAVPLFVPRPPFRDLFEGAQEKSVEGLDFSGFIEGVKSTSTANRFLTRFPRRFLTRFPRANQLASQLVIGDPRDNHPLPAARRACAH